MLEVLKVYFLELWWPLMQLIIIWCFWQFWQLVKTRNFIELDCHVLDFVVLYISLNRMEGQVQVTITLFYVSILLWKWEARCSGAAIYFIFYMILKRTISSFSIGKMSVSDFLFMKGTNFAISSCQIKLMYKDINYRSLSLNTTLYFLI